MIPDKNLLGESICIVFTAQGSCTPQRLKRLLGVFDNCRRDWSCCAVTRLAGDLNIKMVGAASCQRIDRTHDLSKVNRPCSLFAGADFAVKVPKIYAFQQSLGSLSLGILANVVLTGVKQAIAVFAFDV